MKIANLILSVLVLLMAVFGAVFSFLLFQKRGELVDGWNKLTVAINRAAGNLDSESGTAVAQTLTPDALKHQNYSQLDSKLSQLTQQTEKLIQERNQLADTLYRIGRSVNARGADSTKLRNLESSKAASDQVIRAVSDVLQRHQQAMRKVADELRNNLRLQLNSNALLNKEDRAMHELSSGLRNFKQLLTEYEGTIKMIAGESGIGNLRLGNQVRQDARRVVEASKNVRRDKARLQGNLNTANGKIRSLESTLRQREKEIASLKQQISKINARLSEMKIVLKIDPKDDIPTVWKPGSIEARMAIYGQIIEVNKHYGYVGISIGKATRVSQLLGVSKSVEIDPQIVPGLQLKVYRGRLNAGKPQYVGTVIIDKVNDDCSIADLPRDCDIQIGDNVCFEPTEKNTAVKKSVPPAKGNTKLKK